ncbi:MAG TPA: spore maturation protein [Firmicutes bacterium]|nr:spore maturation protein [Bacillota bacterium]
MLSIIWAGMIILAVAYAAVTGGAEEITTVLFAQAARGVTMALEVMSIITVWFGLSRIAAKAGLLPAFGRLIAPLIRPLFPGVPAGHPAIPAMGMNLAANLLGLANAATPFGLEAMRALQRLNPLPRTATPAMVTFLVLNSACATLVPSTAIALRANAGAQQPSAIIAPAFLASSVALAAVLIIDRLWRWRYRREKVAGSRSRPGKGGRR